MKIGIFIDRVAPGSSPKTIGQAVKGLQALGHECEAVVLVGGFPEKYEFHMGGVPIRPLMEEFPSLVQKVDFCFPGFSFFSLHHLSSGIFSPKVVKDKEWDVLIVHGTYTCFAARALYKQRGIPYIPFIWDPASYIMPKVYTKRGLGKFFPVLIPMAKYVDKYVLEKCQAVITSGNLHHNMLRKFTDKPLEIIFPGCFPPEEFVPWDERENLMLTFDRWDIGNTPNQFLDMLEQMESDAKLVIGGHWYPENLKDLFLDEAKQRNLLDKVIIEGVFDEKKIQEWCSKVKVHLHPNEEAFGMQCLEAASCGCPIIVPEGSGVTELFEHGVHGFFPPTDSVNTFRGDMSAYAKYADKILLSPELGAGMSNTVWKDAREQTWQKHAKRLEEIILTHIEK